MTSNIIITSRSKKSRKTIAIKTMRKQHTCFLWEKLNENDVILWICYILSFSSTKRVNVLILFRSGVVFVSVKFALGSALSFCLLMFACIYVCEWVFLCVCRFFWYFWWILRKESILAIYWRREWQPLQKL